MAGPRRILARWRLTPRLAIAVALALLLASLGAALYNEHLASRQKLRDVAVQAEILAGSVAGALAFDDHDTAQEYVEALRANRDIEAAGVYDAGGRLTAGFARTGALLPRTNQVGPPRTEGARLVVTTPVAERSTGLGSVYLRTITEPLERRLLRYAGVGLLMVMASLMVAGFGASSARLSEAHRKLQAEMGEREKAEAALRRSQELEALAQLEIATERGRAALRQSEQQLEFALEAGRLGSWDLDLASGRLSASKVFIANLGLEPGASLDHHDQVLARIDPEDRERHAALVKHAGEQSAELESEFRTLTPGGETRWMLLRGRVLYDEAGSPVRAAGVSMDTTGRKQGEARQRLLLDELNHRVKNTLATVQSIAMQTSRSVARPEQFEATFRARIGALAHAHELLSEASWAGASLSDVIGRTLAPYLGGGPEGGRVNAGGPGVRLGPNAAVSLNMAFHELATNAAKYGALSVGSGRVDVSWRIVRAIAGAASGPESNAVDICWTESGGPVVARPTRRGFGTRLIEQGIAREFDGDVNLVFEPGGLCCSMRLPLSIKLREEA